MINKNSFLYTLLIFAALSLASCSDDEKGNAQPKESPLVLINEAFTFDSGDGQTWHSSQKVGVFMVEAGSTNIIKNYSNWQYFADNRSYNGYLVPANNEAMYLPNDGTKVDIIAYYPYRENETLTRTGDYHFNIDISDQSKAKAEAFLYSQNAKELNSNNQKATVQLKPVLSKIKLNFTPSAGMSEDNLKKVNAHLTGMSTNASFDLLNGLFSFPDQNEEDKKIELKKIGNGLQAESIIFPGTITEDTQLELKVPIAGSSETKTLTWNLNNEITSLEGNIQYDMLVEVGENSIKATITNKSPIYIQDWNNDDAIDGSASVIIPDLVKNGDMERMTVGEITTVKSDSKANETWYVIKKSTTAGTAAIVNESAPQNNVMNYHITTYANWYSGYIAYRLNTIEKAKYKLSFKIKGTGSTVYAYIKSDEVTDANGNGTGKNNFFAITGENSIAATTKQAGSKITLTDTWKEYTIDLDFNELIVGSINSVTNAVKAATDAAIAGCYIGFTPYPAAANFYIDDVSLTKIK